jgi:hypothetical protein
MNNFGPSFGQSYDDWKTSPPDEPITIGECVQCKEELYAGDDVYQVEGGILHQEECFEQWCQDYIQLRGVLNQNGEIE